MEKIIAAKAYRAERLACPLCRGPLAPCDSGLQCAPCQRRFGRTRGFIDLRPDSQSDTQLQEASYDKEHGITDQRRLNHWRSWQELLERNQAHSGSVLEIGAGSGYLSWGLLHDSRFDEIHISDISADFLQSIVSRQDPGTGRSAYYLCDANHLPFANNSMDCIIGNSVLHHFLDYEQTLRSAQAVLKPGGKAFFFEPVQSGKAFISLLARLLWKVDSQAAQPVFSKEQHKRLHHVTMRMARQAPSKQGAHDLQALAALEDKYIFDVASLARLSRELGFSGFHTENQQPFDYSYWAQMALQLELGNPPIDRQVLRHYEYLFNAVRDTLGAMIKDSMSSPMVYLVFTK